MSQWDAAYRRGVPPPWDIGRAQPELERLADSGAISGRVIDVGCGTGENALMLAAHGLEVVGVDVARTAVERARDKAAERGLAADFHVWNALELGRLIERIGLFDCAIDSGVFHTFSDEERAAYVSGLASAVRPGGWLFLMAFSEHEPDWGGPRRVTQAEIRAAFSAERGWSVEEIRAVRFHTLEGHPSLEGQASRGGPHAWLAAIKRV